MSRTLQKRRNLHSSMLSLLVVTRRNGSWCPGVTPVQADLFIYFSFFSRFHGHSVNSTTSLPLEQVSGRASTSLRLIAPAQHGPFSWSQQFACQPLITQKDWTFATQHTITILWTSVSGRHGLPPADVGFRAGWVGWLLVPGHDDVGCGGPQQQEASDPVAVANRKNQAGKTGRLQLATGQPRSIIGHPRICCHRRRYNWKHAANAGAGLKSKRKCGCTHQPARLAREGTGTEVL